MHRYAEGKSEEENMRAYKEEFVPSKLVPVMDRFNQRFESSEWFIGNKVSYQPHDERCMREGITLPQTAKV